MLNDSNQNDHKERLPEDLGIIIERRQIGTTQLRIGLCEHSEETAEAIEKAMHGCGILAIEQPGHTTNLELAKTEVIPKERMIGQKLQQTVDHITENHTKAIIIDMPREHPDYPIVEAERATRMEYGEVLFALQPAETIRDRLIKTTHATAHSYEVRDKVLTQQLGVVVPGMVQDIEVGVLIGAMHYRAVPATDSPEDAIRLAQRVKVTLPAYDLMVEAIREDEPFDDSLVNRAMLDGYMSTYRLNFREVEAKGAVLDPDLVKRILAQIAETSKEPSGLEERRQKIGDFLRAILTNVV